MTSVSDQVLTPTDNQNIYFYIKVLHNAHNILSTIIVTFNSGRTSPPVGRPLGCRAIGSRFDPQSFTGPSQGLKIAAKCRPCTEKDYTFAWK